ncbi:hypothetical protein CAF53_03330 [Sphingobium sp. LB126]|uniref:TonB-dependent receptor n=1 Tax=Sphingobium sp. LB126 TaxID=1983755 RepID=UPI000C208CC8|nr:TonB-dependent receptor [Sphingobium sp. LB126]PJG47379.1 hypothetical protein CAF53_03330 [Sphingobium sp. LB126]
MKKIAIGSTLAIATTLISATAWAQIPPGADSASTESPRGQQDDSRIGEIVVTARRQAESLTRVPIAVAVIDSSTLERSAATSLATIARLTSQVQIFDKSTPNGSFLAIRGIGAASQDQGVEQSVLVDIDGVQISRGRITGLAMFDLQQVEILKGPQSLFFGKNSPAGVISVKSKGPGDRLEGYIRAGYEFAGNERSLEGALGGPLTETFGVRLAARYNHVDGWVRNVAPKGPLANPFDPARPLPGRGFDRSPESTEYNARLTAHWKPTADFDATLKILGGVVRGNGDGNNVESYCEPGKTRLTEYGVADPYSDCKIDGRISQGAINPALAATIPGFRNGIPYSRMRTLLPSLTMNYSFGGMTLTSTTGYYYYNVKAFDNFGGTVYGNIASYNPQRNKTLTQEVRLASAFDGPIDFMVGGFFQRDRRSNENFIRFGNFGPDTATGNDYSYVTVESDRATVYSGFAQLKWQLNEAFELSGGARYTHEAKTARRLAAFAHEAIAAGFLPGGTLLGGKFVDDNIAPEVTLSWHPDRDTLLYASYKTGYHSGGFGDPSTLSPFANLGPVGTPGTLQFGSEKAKGGEIGYKASLLDRRLHVELAVFHYTFDDLQVVSFDAPTTTYSISNAGKARTRGFEGSIDWRAMRDLRLNGSFGYAKANYLRYTTAPCTAAQAAATPACTQDLSGRALPRAPRFTASAGFDYGMDLPAGLRLGIDGDAKYSGASIQQENLDPNTRQGSYWLLNAGISLHDANDARTIRLSGRNLTNERPLLYSFDKPGGTPGEYFGFPLRPREIRVELSHRF